MPLNREPKWLSKEPVSTANAELKEALNSEPFEGALAVNALANFIKAADVLRATPRSRITPEAATKQIINRIVEARDTAERAPDPTYAQIFGAQLIGWKAAARAVGGNDIQQDTPTQTEAKSMSDGKSNQAS